MLSNHALCSVGSTWANGGRERQILLALGFVVYMGQSKRASACILLLLSDCKTLADCFVAFAMEREKARERAYTCSDYIAGRISFSRALIQHPSPALISITIQ